MTTDDRPDDAPSHDDAHPGTDRYGTSRGLGRNDPSLYGTDVPGAPLGAGTADPAGSPGTAGDTVEGLTNDAAGVGPGGAGAMVAGASGGLMGAASDTSGAATMGSGEARGGMGAAEPDVDGSDAGVQEAALPAAPGTAVSSGGPISGPPAGSGPQTPAV